MAQPSFKIKLRLTSPKDSNATTPISSTPSSAPSSPKRPASNSSVSEATPKRSRIRSKKPATPQASTPINTTTNDHSTSTNLGKIKVHKILPTKRKDPSLDRVYERFLHTRILLLEVELPSRCWKSDESMKLNKRTTEPTSLADIDQLFTVEKDFRPFLCTHVGCSKSFTSFDLLQTHETNMHGIKKMVCGIDGCQKGFATSGQLTKHRKMVHFRAARKAKKLAEAEAEANAASTSATATATPTATTPSAVVTEASSPAVNVNDDDDDTADMTSVVDEDSS
ncbi:unnamed protein product [Absidia cylindrospora]